jgi:hypothetical protein
MGTVMSWLSPGIPRSVAPRGIPEPLVDPKVDAVELDAVEVPGEMLVAAEPHGEDAVEPPPSNAAEEVVFGHGICSGLNPAGLSSVAPSGIPPEVEAEDGSDSVVPSGDVAPMPGVGLACALAAAIPANHMIAAKVHVACIEIFRVVSGLTSSTAVLAEPGARGHDGGPCLVDYTNPNPFLHKPVLGRTGSATPIGNVV